MLTELHAIFTGQVQGVGFRYTAKNYALALGISGTIKNLEDGSVEMTAQGDEKALEKLLDQLQNEAYPGQIDHIHRTFQNVETKISTFSIIR